MPILTCPIPKDAWVHEIGQINGSARPQATAIRDGGPWEASIQKIVEFQQLSDDWDGCGAKAPSRELLESAVGLAYLFRDQGVPAPVRVVPGLDGIVLLEWQFPDGAYAEVEIVRPLFAEVMLIEPDKPAKHWTLPTETPLRAVRLATPSYPN
jgi:hypothetical protein